MAAKIVFETTATAAMPYATPAGGEPARSRRASPKLRLTSHMFRKANPQCGLVVSSDETIQQELADVVTRCGLIPFRAFTVGEGRRILGRHEILLVVSHDRLIDGRYEDLLGAAKTCPSTPRVIVISPTGDWPEYFQAISVGAFDFLAYPPIRGELARVVHHALNPADPGSIDCFTRGGVAVSGAEEDYE